MKHSATRALALLKAMNQRAVSSVRDLAADTGISKPSVVRLLAILIEDGYVQHASKAGSYMLARDVLQLAAGFRSDALIERAAAPRMEELTTRVGWPAALGIFEQGAMVVRYSTIPTSPLSWYRTTLHHRLGLLDSAMGLVYLAFSDEHVRMALLPSAPSEEFGVSETCGERFEQVRARGYAIRAPTAKHPTLSLSVPLLHRTRVLAALSLTLFGRAMPAQEAVLRYLGPLRQSADAIIAQSLLND